MQLPPTLKHYISVGEHVMEEKTNKQMQDNQPNIVQKTEIGWQLSPH